MAIDRIADPWGTRTPYEPGTRWPERVDTYLTDGLTPESVDRWVQSAAVLHSNGDGLDIAVKDGRIVGVRGRAVDRVNHGRLDPKDLFGWQANHSRDRLTTPMIRVGGELKPCDWDTAMDRIVARSRQLLDRYGPSSIGFYTSGQLFLEAYYTQGAIAHGAIGTNHVDGNTRLCTATATDPESAFEAWKKCSAGRPCDYTGLSYEKLRGGSGIQWPCNAEHPDGTERLYADAKFWAHPEYCEAYGKDLITGAPLQPDEYRSMNPYGKAIIKAAEYVAPHERPSSEYPFALITGRTVYHFHTRTKTARAHQLQVAAPEVWVEVSERDAHRLGIGEGDLVEVRTPRGCVTCAARICGIRDGVLFVPFHYGYWDADTRDHQRAGNELTLTDWDPVSKQPIYKTAAARLQKARPRHVSRIGAGHAPTTTASAPVNGAVPATVGGAPAGVTEVAGDGR